MSADDALAAARGGLHVFPVEPPIAGDEKSGKRPLGALVPHGKDDATTDETIIRRWWSQRADANYGIATAPSRLVVLDVDPRHGGNESLAQIAAQLPPTLTVRTGSGGQHLYFVAPSGEPIQRLGVMPGIDLIGNGYVVGPGSTHFTGGRYEIVNATPFAPLPQVLVEMRRAAAASADHKAPEKIPDGQRNDTLFRLGCSLRHKGLDADEIAYALLAVNARRCDPPLAEGEIRTIAAQAGMYEAVDVGTRAQAATVDIFGQPTATACPRQASEVFAIRRTPRTTYATGITKLDELLGGGVKTHEMTGIVARTGAGKTGLVIKLGHFIVRRYDVPFLYISSELEEFEIGAREVAQELGVSHNDVLDGAVPLDQCRAALEGVRAHVVGSETMDEAHGARALEVIEAAITAVTSKYGKRPVVAVDFLQEIAADDDDPKAVRMSVTKVARKLRGLAQRLGVVMIAVSSTGRAFYKPPKEGADDPISYLGAAKESGDIEFALANLLFLDVASEHDAGTYAARVAVAKARHGSVGFVGAKFHGPSGRWDQDDAALPKLTGEQRRATADAAKKNTDDDKVFAFIIGELRDGRRYTATGIRDRVEDVPDKRCRTAINRLIREGRLVELNEWDRKGNKFVDHIVPAGTPEVPR